MQRTEWDDVTTWPSLSDAAGMLHVHKATLSRQAQRGNVAAQVVGFGSGKRLVSPAEVLRLGRLYRRVPQAVLERDLGVYVAERTRSDVRRRDHDPAPTITATDAAAGRRPLGGAEGGQDLPAWMAEFSRLFAQSTLQPDTAPFIAADREEDAVYAGIYREADEATLIELTGIDPAVFRS
jgi:hypothetical protein